MMIVRVSFLSSSRTAARSFLSLGRNASNANMGFGLPYAIGSCYANDKRRTILINGDGAFQMNIQELETIFRLQLPIKIFMIMFNEQKSFQNRRLEVLKTLRSSF